MTLCTLAVFGAVFMVNGRWNLLIQVGVTLVFVVPIYLFRDRLRQDAWSCLFVGVTAVLHAAGLYSTKPLGIRFDHYTHVIGGFGIAMVVDRWVREPLTGAKRFFLLVMTALGVGSMVEIVQWVDGYIVPGVEICQADELSNSIADMICNGIGGTVMGITALFKKRRG